ncbi:MAG: hypothetical protein FJY85_24650, partial [Deltaproteobacteria bacterium]|nr:hypothetical protein [Deltaproteobacteria bacterium]
WRTLAYDLTGGQVLDSKAAFTPGGMVDYGLDPWGNKTDEEYDTAGRLVQTSLLRGQNVFIEKRSITYDLIGNRESEATTSYNETEQGGSTAGPVRYSHFKHNAAGWLLQTALGGAVPPAWNHWEYRCYDSFGYLRREYDARNMVEPQDQPTVRVKQYDFGGHVTRSQTLLDGTETPYPYWQETVYEYDLAGRLVLYLAIGNVEQENASYSAGWDFANRVTSRVYNDGKSESFSYACCGLLSSMTRRNGMNYTYQYDRHKRLREVRYTGGGNRIWNGNVTKTTKIVYKYDSGESGWLHLPLGVETYSDTTMLTAVMRTYTSLGEIASDWVWDVEAGVVKSVNYSYSRTGE